jgi:crotonobetainyl-CoA:carnitine CoA-transferase CaiB-like acyl-CoA transferase
MALKINGTTRHHGPGILSGLNVVECGEGIAAAFATKMMADLGANVIKVEPVSGDALRRRGPFPQNLADPEKSGLFLYLNNNKRGVTLDLAQPDARSTLSKLLSRADLLVHNVHPRVRTEFGLNSDSLSKEFPSLIIAGISPFGDTGRYKDWNAYPLTVENAAGMAFLAPGAAQHPELPPLKAFGQQAEYQGGLHACFAALAAYYGRLKGEPALTIEISEQECLAAMLEMNLMHYTYAGRETSRLGKRLLGPWLLADCSDGVIFMACAEEAQWQRLVELMGNPEWAQEELFKDRLIRGANADALNLFINEWTASWKARDLFLAGQGNRIPFASVNRMQDIYADDQLNSRDYFAEIDYSGIGKLRMPGPPTKYGVGGWAIRNPAPRLGQHNHEILDGELAPKQQLNIPTVSSRAVNPSLPLAGVRILDFTWVWAGPFATLQMAHMGAEVLRIESEKRPCITRMIPPFADNIPGPNRAGYFNQYNQGKRSVTLNLADPAGLQLAFELVRHCDVVVENFAGGVMQRMGLGYEKLREYRPDLIMISMSGYGQNGPYKNFLGYGPPAAALSGFFSTMGYSGSGPSELGISYMDPNAGISAAVAVMAALVHRNKTGEGQFIDQSQLETAIALMGEGLLQYAMTGEEPQRMGNHDRIMAPHNTYKALGDADRWVSIAVGNEVEWRALCKVIGQPGLADDSRFATLEARKQNENELDRIITEWSITRDRWDATNALQHAGVAAFPSMSNKDLATNEHLRERGFAVEVDHSEIGRRTHVGMPWTVRNLSRRVRSAAPLRGADTDSVLSRLLSYSPAQIEELRNAGILS